MTPAVTHSNPSSRLQAVDGLRGYAALAVVFYHAILMFVPVDHLNQLLASTIPSLSGYESLARLVIALTSGETAVAIFFVISGTVLLKSLDRDLGSNGLGGVLSRFALRRIFRIYPALVGCLLAMFVVYDSLAILLPQVYAPPRFTDFLVNMSLYDIRVHGATWTLKAEILAIPFILAAFVLRKYAGAFGICLLAAYSILLIDFPRFGFGIYLLPNWLKYFVAGFIAYDLSKTSFIRQVMMGRRWMLVLAGAVLARPVLSMSSEGGILLQLFCVMVLVSYMAGGHSNALARFLSTRHAVFLGKISYSLYLWNVIFLNVLLAPALELGWVRQHYLECGLVAGILATAMSIPFSIGSQRWLERPFMRLWHDRSTRSTRPAVVPVDTGEGHAAPANWNVSPSR
jgi:peptidoglycan/LPS O-acetylase OafA/YrhL